MLCEEEEAADTFANDVLILVLMEDALRVTHKLVMLK